MTALLEFIEQRLQDDQDRALAAAEILRCGCHATTDDGRASWTYEPLDDGVWHTSNLHPVFRARQWETGHLEDEIGEHVAAHDPARVLREVAAKRSIVEECKSTMAWVQELRREGKPADAYARHVGSLLGVLKTFAEVWRDHPDYDPTWSPA